MLGPLLAISISFKVRPVYTSQAFVLVDQPRGVREPSAPDDSDDMYTPLLTLQEQILSRSWLEPIIDQLGLYNEGSGAKASMADSYPLAPSRAPSR